MKPYIEKRYQSEEDWVEARKGGIGGSDVGAVMGLSKWTSPLEVWLVKTGRAEPPDLSDNEKVEWGTRLEPLVAQKFAEMHPEYRVKRKNCTMVSKERPWAFANIDRELVCPDGSRGVLEIKTAGARSSGEWVFGPPDHYLAQIQHYLSVTHWDFAWCAVLIGGQEYREYRVERDESDIEAIDRAVDAFWNEYVLTDTIPEMTGNGGEGPALAAMYPDPSDGYVPVTDCDLPELSESAELSREIKAMQERKKLLDNELKAKIGDSRGVESESTRCTWVRSTQRRFDQGRFREEKPELYDEYSDEKPRDMGLRFSPAAD